METSKIKAIVAILVLAACSAAATAATVDVTVQANLVKDPNAALVFGYTDASVPILVSFSFDDAASTMVSAGAPISGTKSFSSDAYLIDGSSVTNFQAAIGDQTFAAADLLTQQLGTSANAYSVLLLGALADHGVSGGQVSLNSALGMLDFGAVDCASQTCSTLHTGYAEDDIYFTVGGLTDIQFDAHVVPTPLPATVWLMLSGLGGVGLMARKRRAA